MTLPSERPKRTPPTAADAIPCPCGCPNKPVPVIERGARKAKVLRVRCPQCRLTSASARPERIWIAWNMVAHAALMARGGKA